MLPLSPGRAESHGFEYKRNGTLSLFAALNTATGEVIGNTGVANPWQIAFLSNNAFSKRTDVYLTAAYARNAGLGIEFAAIFYANSLSSGNINALGKGESSMLDVAVGVRHKF